MRGRYGVLHFHPSWAHRPLVQIEGLLHTLMIRCPQTGQSISTGFETDENSFSQTLTCSRTRAVPCACSTRMVVAGGGVIGSSSDKFASADRGLVGAAQKADEA